MIRISRREWSIYRHGDRLDHAFPNQPAQNAFGYARDGCKLANCRLLTLQRFDRLFALRRHPFGYPA